MKALPPLLEYWYMAKNSQAGIKLRVNNVDRALAKLYAARTKACDPTLKTLSLIRSPTAHDEIWIVHREAPDVETENPSGSEEGDDELPQVQL